MAVSALLMDAGDNVATCVREVGAGEEVSFLRAGAMESVVAGEAIPFCHKVALCDLGEGDAVIKYGEPIGRTTCAIARGGLVDHRNLRSVPRDYDSELLGEE
ncbi:MAG: UxaA family hydrolase [Succinivibrionaceae bacterium]|nr:UxaA family hydrolase [Succinivibrionaceae bacterium]